MKTLSDFILYRENRFQGIFTYYQVCKYETGIFIENTRLLYEND